MLCVLSPFNGELMLKSCKYCGRVHDEHNICPQKKEALERRERAKNSHRGREGEFDYLRHKNRWARTRDYVYHRDRCLCLCCLAELDGTVARYNTQGLEVHHIIPLNADPSKAYDTSNLITVCRRHHDDCESGVIGRDIQSILAQASAEGRMDLNEVIKEMR